MIKHIVFWKIHKDGSAEQKRESIEAFRRKTARLAAIIPQIQEARVAANFAGGNGFDVCIDSVFQSREDLDAYINHPEHLKVRAFMDTIQYDKTVFDYEY